MTRLGGLGFLDSFHCEKTSFLTFGSFIAVITLTILWVGYGELPTTDVFGLFDFPVSYLMIAIAFTIGGYLGVLYYRFTNNKRPLFVLQFWNSEA